MAGYAARIEAVVLLQNLGGQQRIAAGSDAAVPSQVLTLAALAAGAADCRVLTASNAAAVTTAKALAIITSADTVVVPIIAITCFVQARGAS